LLTRKLAEKIDGVNLKSHHVGDVLELPTRDARLLLAEEWARPDRRETETGRLSIPERRRPATSEETSRN
jgi:hypothetical protein